MIPIAQPIADDFTAESILRRTRLDFEAKRLVSGIKACQKNIMNGCSNKLLVLSAKTSPMDLITHIPILCEHKHVPYIFIPENSWIQGFTCVLLDTTDKNEDVSAILEKSHK